LHLFSIFLCLETFGKDTIFYVLFNCKFSFSARLSGGGWAKPKMAKPILGRGVGGAV